MSELYPNSQEIVGIVKGLKLSAHHITLGRREQNSTIKKEELVTLAQNFMAYTAKMIQSLENRGFHLNDISDAINENIAIYENLNENEIESLVDVFESLCSNLSVFASLPVKDMEAWMP